MFPSDLVIIREWGCLGFSLGGQMVGLAEGIRAIETKE
jgi:hypothetical protein